MSDKPVQYIIIGTNEPYASVANKVSAYEEAQKMHDTTQKPVYIYALLDTIGTKRYHYRVFNNDKLKILDSGDIKHFEGYQTYVGARYIGESAAQDIKLEPGYTVEVY